MTPPLPHLGEILALACALVWSLSVILFKKSGEVVHPVALNLFKNVLAIVLLVPTIWIAGVVWPQGLSVTDYAIIFLSGVFGIGIADTLFFMALNRLGAGLSAIVDCLYSPTVIVIAALWLGERMNALQILGALMIVSAVLIATVEKPQGKITPHAFRWGVAFGATGIVLIGIAVVTVKPLLEQLPLLWVTEMRLIAGSAVLVIFLSFRKDRTTIVKSLLSTQHRVYTFVGSLLGAYVAMILWLGGMKYTQASIAAALNQTSNVMIFVLAALVLKEPITLKRSIGIALGVGGAYLVTFA